jgi:hypothetical protein
MSSHTCLNCGTIIPCDKRNIGTGRKHDVDWQPGPNHETVLKALRLMDPWQTVKGIQQYLNHRVDSNDSEYRHVGKSPYWTQLAVQTPVSDLLGIDVLECTRAAKGRELLYRVKTL